MRIADIEVGRTYAIFYGYLHDYLPYPACYWWVDQADYPRGDPRFMTAQVLVLAVRVPYKKSKLGILVQVRLRAPRKITAVCPTCQRDGWVTEDLARDAPYHVEFVELVVPASRMLCPWPEDEEEVGRLLADLDDGGLRQLLNPDA